eukprot:9318351-Alexandrium_andersonii.AAC.1
MCPATARQDRHTDPQKHAKDGMRCRATIAHLCHSLTVVPLHAQTAALAKDGESRCVRKPLCIVRRTNLGLAGRWHPRHSGCGEDRAHCNWPEFIPPPP